MEKIGEKIKEIISNLLENPLIIIENEVDLHEYGITSISFIKIIVQLEELLDKEFDNDILMFEDKVTVNDIIRLIEE